MSKPDKRQLRAAARLFATQALFQMEASDAALDDVREEFETHRFGAEIDGDTYAEADIDLFRAAGAELILAKTPPKVVITEFVDVAKAFFPEGREAKFVNAVLDHMARAIAPDAFA